MLKLPFFQPTANTLALAALLGLAAPAATRAAINVGGTQSPPDSIAYLYGESGYDATFWENGGNFNIDGFIGYSAEGTLTADGSSVLLMDEGILGHNSGITGTATFSGGAQWALSNDLEVGHDGTGYLYIYTGSQVNAGDDLYIGYNEGSSGTVLVDGLDSQLTANDDFVVGDDGTGQLTLQNQAYAEGDNISIGRFATGSGTVQVTGTGTALRSYGDIIVGNAGVGSLTVQDGAKVYSQYASLAYLGAASEGEVLVEGADSEWVNSGDMIIGDDGTGSLIVRNGGAVSATTVIVSQYADSDGSLDVVTTIEDSTATFYADGNLTVANEPGTTGSVNVQGAGAQLTVEDDINLGHGGDGSLSILDGGVATVNGSVSAGQSGYDHSTHMDVPGTGDILVRGTDSTLDVANNITIGIDGTGTLTVDEGGYATAQQIIVGENAGIQGTLIVDGATSAVDVDYDLIAGQNGNATVTFRNGAVVTTGGDTTIGNGDTSQGTLAIESGASLTTGTVSVGSAGSGSLTVEDGATLTASELAVSDGDGSQGTLIVDGAETTVGVSGGVIIGNGGNGGNGMATLSNGASVTGGGYAFVGLNTGSTGTLTIESGASFAASYLSIGDDGEGGAFSQGDVTVTGSGSSLTTEDAIILGNRGIGSLAISDSATVSATALIIAQSDGSDGTLTVDGAGTTLDLDYEISVGQTGTGRATLSNGASVTSDETYVGGGELSAGTLAIESGASLTTGNVTIADYAEGENFSTGDVTVTGSGSLLSSSSSIAVGARGNASLAVSDGATVEADGGMTVAQEAGSTGAVTIADTGSRLDIDGQVRIGAIGEGSLAVTGGATATVGDIIVASQGTGTLTVQGAGSQLTSTANFTVGDESAGTVSILDGGRIDVTNSAYVADYLGTATVTVRGEGSTWSIGRTVEFGPGNTATLEVSQGGTVQTGEDFNLGSEGTANLMVGTGASVTTGTLDDPDSGDFHNDGTVNLVADATLEAGTYTPIVVRLDRAFTGSGTYNAIGGTWDDSAHTFSVSAITTDGTGDLSGKRVIYYDSLVVSFGDGVGEQAFAVTQLDLDTIDDETVLAAYDFTTDLDELTALSFLIGEGYDESLIHVWHLADGETEWTLYDAGLTSYLGDSYAFTVEGFSSYALTVVPEPTTTAFALAGLAFLALSRRRRPL